MPKTSSDAVLDGTLDILSASTQMTWCEGQPLTYEEANSTKGTGAGKVLFRTPMTPGDYTKADGSIDGRQVTLAAFADLTIQATGTADHIALTTVVGTTLDHVTDVPTPLAVTQGGQVSTNPTVITVRDPT